VANVTLGFKAYDVHELACHFVARQFGLYKRHGLQVCLLDTTFIPDVQLPPNTLQTACGAALTAWLDGADTRVVFVATDRPMFWLYSHPDVRQLSDLEGNTVAGFPAMAPPALFFRTILKSRSINPDRVVTVPARDDVARLGLLSDGSVSAALLSSAVSPQSMGDRGFGELLFFGDEIRLPTTGLAASGDMIETERDLIVAMCRCYREALELIHNEAGVLEAALAKYVTPVRAEQAAMANRVRGCYTRDGRSSQAMLNAAIGMLSDALNTAEVLPVNSLYDFSALESI